MLDFWVAERRSQFHLCCTSLAKSWLQGETGCRCKDSLCLWLLCVPFFPFGWQPRGIRLDSGDLAYLSNESRALMKQVVVAMASSFELRLTATCIPMLG